LAQCQDSKKEILMCPLDRIEHKNIKNVRKLPTNFAVVDWLALIGDMKNQQIDVWAEVETVQNCIQQTENLCDFAVEQLRKSVRVVEEMKRNLVDKRNIVENYFNDVQNGAADDAKDHSMATVVYSCNFMQKMCTKLVSPAFNQLNQSISNIQEVSNTIKLVDVLDFNLKPDRPMHEGKVCQTISTVTDTILQSSNFAYDPKKFAEKLASDVKQKFGNHLWTVLIGRSDMKLSVMCSEDDYISLSTADHKIVVYRSNPTSKVYDKAEKLLRSFVQSELQSGLKQKSKSDDFHVEKRMKELLVKKYGGEWHIVSYCSGTGAVHCTGCRRNVIELNLENRLYYLWQCVDV